MNKFGQTICLSMIVKNEAPVITRCLESVRRIIDHWIIVDTGSTDGTQQIIKDYFKDIPGELHEKKWKDFAFNRSQALELSRSKADYSLVIDADDFLQYPENFEMPYLGQNCYTMNLSDQGLSYPRIQLMSNLQNWYYRGVLHEFAACDAQHTVGNLPIIMVRNHDGARRRDPTTYTRDAGILAKALVKEKDPFLKTRYTFYLAQSYRDCRDFQKALHYYMQRSTMGGWQEEVFYSLYQAARLREALGHPLADVIEAYEAATAALPHRNEARHAASRFCRLKGLYQKGYDLAKAGLHLAYPAGCLFGEPGVYEFGLLDEFAVNAYWIGAYFDCLDVCLRLIASGKIPPDYHERIVKNAAEATKMIKARDAGGAPVAPQVAIPQPVPTLVPVPPQPMQAGYDLVLDLGLDQTIEVLDIGASVINEQPVYKHLLQTGKANLNAFDGDERQIASLKLVFGDNIRLFKDYLYDGSEATVHLAEPVSGMTSLLEPDMKVLEFFNGFPEIGRQLGTTPIKTVRLDDVAGLPPIDYLKMDIQGAELTVLHNGMKALSNCLMMQLEVSFITLYKNQPTLGEIDLFMREHGFVPHCFTEIKRWSITPTIYHHNFRVGGNQLLEGDLVYIRDPFALDRLDDTQLKKLAAMAHYFYGSTDLCHYLMLELQKRGSLEQTNVERYSALYASRH
jgi:FkbM family methyltransferase